MTMYNVQIKVNMRKITSNVPDLSAAILILVKQFLLIMEEMTNGFYTYSGFYIYAPGSCTSAPNHNY